MTESSTNHLPADMTHMGDADCPTWCTDHTGFDDGSEDWHESRTVELPQHRAWLTTGVPQHEVHLGFEKLGGSDHMPLADAEALARGILALVAEVRA